MNQNQVLTPEPKLRDERALEAEIDDEIEDELEDDLVEDELDSEEKVRLMAEAADAVRATRVLALDLRELTIVTDFFFICTGNSGIQIRAIADRIEDRLRDEGYRKLRVEGYQEATWILLDYGDVVAHIMAEEARDFYKIEDLWQAAPQLTLDLLAPDSPSRALRNFDLMPDDDDDEDDEDDEDEDEDEEE